MRENSSGQATRSRACAVAQSRDRAEGTTFGPPLRPGAGDLGMRDAPLIGCSGQRLSAPQPDDAPVLADQGQALSRSNRSAVRKVDRLWPTTGVPDHAPGSPTDDCPAQRGRECTFPIYGAVRQASGEGAYGCLGSRGEVIPRHVRYRCATPRRCSCVDSVHSASLTRWRCSPQRSIRSTVTPRGRCPAGIDQAVRRLAQRAGRPWACRGVPRSRPASAAMAAAVQGRPAPS